MKSRDILGVFTTPYELIRTPAGTTYIRVTDAKGSRPYELAGTLFRNWLRNQCFERGARPTAAKLSEAIDLLEAEADLQATVQEIRLRVGRTGDTIWIDMASKGQTIQITPSGYSVVDKADVLFRQSSGIGALPAPVNGSGLDALRALLNVKNDNDWVLIVSWLLAALEPTWTKPVLVLQGPPGTAKTSMTRLLRYIVDPTLDMDNSTADNPRNADDMWVRAKHSWIVPFDNMSSIPLWLSDTLCQFATGGSHSKRKNYTDAEEVRIAARRPVIINGINHLVAQADLASRAIVIELPIITPSRRITERALLAELDANRAGVLGDLCRITACALGGYARVQAGDLERMADLQQWMVAAEPALGWPTGTSAAAWRENQSRQCERRLSDSPVVAGIHELVARHGTWRGTATDLLEEFRRSGCGAGAGSALAMRHLVEKHRTLLEQAGIAMQTGQRDPSRNRDRIIVLSRSESCEPGVDGGTGPAEAVNAADSGICHPDDTM